MCRFGRRDLFRVIDLDDNGSVDHEEFFKDAGMLLSLPTVYLCTTTASQHTIYSCAPEFNTMLEQSLTTLSVFDLDETPALVSNR